MYFICQNILAMRLSIPLTSSHCSAEKSGRRGQTQTKFFEALFTRPLSVCMSTLPAPPPWTFRYFFCQS